MSSKGSHTHITNQIITAIIQNRSFDTHLAKSPFITHHFSNPQRATQLITDTLRSIPRYFFQSPRSMGRQPGSRHRTPLKQRNLHQESINIHKGITFFGPAAYRDPQKVKLGLDKALEFYHWVESQLGFNHTEITCREMGIILIKGNRLKELYNFLKDMSRRSSGGLVTTMTMTCLIKCLGEQGLVNEALSAFYRMKQFRCRPDVCAYNTVINALCRVGDYKRAKFLFEQMELPGFRCPPDTFTYTILISSYCKHSLQTGCKKAVRRRMWEANHLFRLMLFKGFKPDVVTYNCLIDGCCKTYRIERALELFDDMGKRGCVPNRVTYNSFIRFYCATNEIDKAIEMLHRMQELDHGLPTTSSYTPVIHAFCEAGKAVEAWNMLVELVDRGSIPREYTYKIVHEGLKSVGRTDLLDSEICGRIEDGITIRYKQVMKVKAVMSAEPRFSLGDNCDIEEHEVV
ncbi:putative tetratricopeptide-like helical domain superfamily [Helianthus annuus]|nr:putative tetratricopeptide-like helical domain superfamily [Helianthus annuus]KAJ0629684.1 putative tetratricopeptide-like helical domain superfamily [Helianthus annuus]KAJ0873656.1 putative tetratricopeptide-like helical domain superfamily [Helianthus annuus]